MRPACFVLSAKSGNVDLLKNSFGEIAYVSKRIGKNEAGVVKHHSHIPLAGKKSVDTPSAHSYIASAAGVDMLPFPNPMVSEY